MKKLSKKLLTVLLALALVISVLTVAALATSSPAKTYLTDAAGLKAAFGNSENVTVDGASAPYTVTIKGSVTYDKTKDHLRIATQVILNLETNAELNMNGKFLLVDEAPDGKKGELTIKGTGKITNTDKVMQVQNGATAIIQGGTIERTGFTVEDVSEPAVVVIGASTLKMSGGTIKSKETTIQVQDAGSFAEITGGTLDNTSGEGKGNAVAVVDESSFTMTGGTIKAKGTAVSVGTTKETDANQGKIATATIKGKATVNCEKMDTTACMMVKDYGVLNVEDNATINCDVCVFENGRLNVSGGTITDEGFAISTNGSPVGSPNTSAGAQIKISGGTIKGTGTDACGVYLPAGEMTVTGGSIEGKAGIVVRGGELSVTGGTITATGSSTDTITVGDAKKPGEDRYTIPAAGITVDNAGYPEQAGGQKHVSISGNATVAASNGGKTVAASANNGNEVDASSGKVAAKDNPFDIQGGKLTVSGKADTENVTKYLPEGYEYKETGVEVKEGTKFLAKIDGGMSYTTLEDALAAATKGNTVQLLEDVVLTGSEDLHINKSITLDLNGKTLTLPDDHNIYIDDNTKAVTIKDSQSGGTIKANFKDNKARGAITVHNNAQLTFESGKIVVTGPSDSSNDGIVVWAGGELNFKGGSINAPCYGIATNGGADATKANVNVYGGSITGGVAGMFLPSQGGTTTIKGDATITGTKGAGVVVRGGTITVDKDEKGNIPTIETKGKEAMTYGHSTNKVPCAAVVLDLDTAYGDDSKKAELKNGKFDAPAGVESVILTNGATIDTNDASDNIDITGGFYSKPVADNYLNSTLNAGITDSTGMTSYYASISDAQNAVPGATPFLTATGETKASIEKFGVVTGAAKANELLNEALKRTGATNAIKDCADNTMYVVFDVPTAQNNGYFLVQFFKGTTKVHEDTAQLSSGKHACYFDVSKLSGGEYTVKIYYKNTSPVADTDTLCGSAKLTVYKITYKVGTGVTGDEEYFFTSNATEFETEQKVVPDSFTLQSGVNKWTYGRQDMDKYNVTITIGGVYSAPVDPGHKCPTKGFKDMEVYDTSKLWYHEAMDYMVTNGYINGFEDNTLQPNGTATRAQMWVIMAQTKGAAVAGNPWYKAAAEWAVKHEYSDGLRPNDYIQREEIVAILWRMADEPKSTQSLSKYSDAASVNDWAKTAMAWAVEKGIISGRTDANGKAVLVPQGIATRAELAVLIYNYVTLMK